MLQQSPVSIQTLFHSILEKKQVELSVMRLDQIHREVSGNKFFKLKYNLAEAEKLEKKTLLTFGGAFSNHIYATASAAHTDGFQSIGIIRGEDADLGNPTLSHAQRMGMRLYLVDRETYREKESQGFLAELKIEFGDVYLIPEGGTNELAIQGTSEILGKSTDEFTHISTCVGTGGTFAGLASSQKAHQNLLGFSALKGSFIHEEIKKLLTTNRISPSGSLEINTDYHFGGYGKYKPELTDFMSWFYTEFQIPLDPIYTGKMAFGLWDLIQKDYFPKNSKILMIHSGGLQGNVGFAAKTGINLPIL